MLRYSITFFHPRVQICENEDEQFLMEHLSNTSKTVRWGCCVPGHSKMHGFALQHCDRVIAAIRVAKTSTLFSHGLLLTDLR